MTDKIEVPRRLLEELLKNEEICLTLPYAREIDALLREAAQPDRYCNKCGYCGPNETHHKPEGGECGYMACPILREAERPEQGGWPMLSAGHLRALTTAYEQGFGKGLGVYLVENQYVESGSLAAAWQEGYEAGAARKAESVASAMQPRPADEELRRERVREALSDAGFRLQDDYYLAHGAPLMSEDSHEIIHRDTVDAIVRAAGSEELRRDAERYRWLLATNRFGCEWDAAIDAAIAAEKWEGE